MLVLIVVLIYFWRDVSEGVGSHLGRGMRKRKPRLLRTISILLFLYSIAFAYVFLSTKCSNSPKLNCTSSLGNQTLTYQIQGATGKSPALSPLLAGAATTLANSIHEGWFDTLFLVLTAVSATVLVRSVIIGWNESRDELRWFGIANRKRGLEGVEHAIRDVESKDLGDPRTRIMSCYGRMIKSAADTGITIEADQTARELEDQIRRLFGLKGPSIGELTQIFEEARYSLHIMTEEDCDRALVCLLQIKEDLGSVEPTKSSEPKVHNCPASVEPIIKSAGNN